MNAGYSLHLVDVECVNFVLRTEKKHAWFVILFHDFGDASRVPRLTVIMFRGIVQIAPATAPVCTLASAASALVLMAACRGAGHDGA